MTQASGPVLPYDRKLAKFERKMKRRDLKHVRPYRPPRRLYPNEEQENEEEPNDDEEEVNLTWDDDFSPMASNAEQQDSLVDHFDSDFLNEVPRMNGISSNQMQEYDEPVYGRRRRRRRHRPAPHDEFEDPWDQHPIGPPLPQAPYADAVIGPASPYDTVGLGAPSPYVNPD